MKFILLTIYSIVMPLSWSLLTTKRFYFSIAPSFFSHIILVFFTGILSNNLYIGFIAGIVICILVILYHIMKYNKDIISKISKNDINQIFVFTIIFIIIILHNYNKTFIHFDEFSHWGMFIKESFRLDKFYCNSPVIFDHKDYVPAITIFQYIVLKILGSYKEYYVYIAMQLLMLSMILPIFDIFYEDNTADKNAKTKKNIIHILSIFVMLFLPMIFNTSDCFYFYRGIYCDFIIGIMLFYIIFLLLKNDTIVYKTVVFAFALTVFVLSKMSSIAMLPLLLLIVVVYVFCHRKDTKTVYLLFLSFVVSIALWILYNLYVYRYINGLNNIQSYGSFTMSSIFDAFSLNTKVQYIKRLRVNYIDALFTRDILIKGSYINVLIAIILILVFVCIFIKSNKHHFTSFIIIAICIFISYLYYAVLQYFLYATQFPEEEVKRLASFERYMNTFVLSTLLLLIYLIISKTVFAYNNKVAMVFVPIILMMYILLVISNVLFGNSKNILYQYKPGIISNDYQRNRNSIIHSNNIIYNIPQDKKVFVLIRGDDGSNMRRMSYYCCPIQCVGGNIGGKSSTKDKYNVDLTEQELVDMIGSCDYFYIYNIDINFINKYKNCFIIDDNLSNGSIFNIIKYDNRIKLVKITD